MTQSTQSAPADRHFLIELPFAQAQLTYRHYVHGGALGLIARNPGAYQVPGHDASRVEDDWESEVITINLDGLREGEVAFRTHDDGGKTLAMLVEQGVVFPAHRQIAINHATYQVTYQVTRLQPEWQGIPEYQ